MPKTFQPKSATYVHHSTRLKPTPLTGCRSHHRCYALHDHDCGVGAAALWTTSVVAPCSGLKTVSSRRRVSSWGVTYVRYD